ncbi:ketopantoate reductase family protein [Paraferrimonas sedimenticola]|uniref:ketopantoate reductase family protein n=1 Tax=Paraferrimonas sedimenticola TaxID=375674 RepID=UPI00147323F2|nr:2-dehydropantoate 2-reductase [Paraferrimonas sedimenticola]
MTAPKIAILGLGAVGQMLLYRLKATGAEPLALPRYQNSLPEQLHFIDRCDEGHEYAPIAALPEQLDALIVCTKAHQVVEAITPYWDSLRPDCVIVLCHNGLGPHLELQPKLAPNQSLLLATTSRGALRHDKYRVEQTGTGAQDIGLWCGPALNPELEAKLAQLFEVSEFAPNIEESVWAKLVVNCAINPLTAIHNCRNGELADTRYRETLLSLVSEVSQVAQMQGFNLRFKDCYARVLTVIHLTAENYSSMHQDVHLKRGSEIDAITGYVCRMGAELGVDTPVNQEIWDKVRRLERLGF